MAELATAYIALVPSLRGAAGAIRKEFGGIGTGGGTEAGHGFRSTFGQIVGGTFVGQILGDVFRAATRGIVEAVRGAFEATARWGTITAQTGAVLKSTGAGAGVTAGQVHDLAMSIERTTGTQAESIQSGENLLLTFRSLKNGVGAGNDVFNQATVALVDMSRALKKDPVDAAIQLGKALNDPITGMTALRRVGVSFTQDQQKLIKSLAESGNVMGAQKVILSELTAEFGGSGAAFAQTFTGKLELMKEAWHHITEELFKGVQPGLGAVFTTITGIFNRLLDSGVLATFSEKLSHLGEGAATKIGDLANHIADFFKTIKGGGIDAFVKGLQNSNTPLGTLVTLFQILSPLAPVVKDALVKLGPALSEILKAILPLVPPLVDLTNTVLPALKLMLDNAVPSIKFFVDALTGKGQFKQGEREINGYINNLHDKFVGGAQQWQSFGAAAVAGIAQLGSQFAIGKNQINSFFQGLGAKFAGGAQQIGSFFATMGAKFAGGAAQIGAFIGTLGAQFGRGAAQIGEFVGRVGAFFGQLGAKFAQGAAQIGQFIGQVGARFAQGAAQIGAFVGNAIGAMGRLLGSVGNAMGQLGAAVGRAAASVGAGMAGIGAAVGRAAGAFGAAVGNIVGGMGRMVGAIAGGVGEAIGVIASLPGKAAAAIGNLGGLLVSAGKNLIGGFVEGIKSMIGAVAGAVGSVMGAAANLIPHSPAKEGPFSGSGWDDVRKGGAALMNQFMGGAGEPDLTLFLASRFGDAAGAVGLPNVNKPVAAVSVFARPAAPDWPAFPDKVTLVDHDGSLLGIMDVKINGADFENEKRIRGGVVR